MVKGQTKSLVCSWSMAFALGHAQVWAPVYNLDLAIAWPVSPLINLEEPGLQYYPSCAQAAVQFWSHLHGFKPAVVVNTHKEITIFAV